MSEPSPSAESIPFNLNHSVFVKLTEHGRKIHRQAHADLNASCGGRLGPYSPPLEDNDGWSRWQLWELMHTFGPHVYNGCKAPIHTIIRFEMALGES